MDPRALDTDQRAQVETGPSGICGGGGDQRKQKCHKLPTAPSPEDEWQLTQSFTVHTQAVAFGVPDGLKGYSFALTAAPSLEQTHTHKHTHRLHLRYVWFVSVQPEKQVDSSWKWFWNLVFSSWVQTAASENF